MRFLCWIVNTILKIFFPLNWFYKRLRQIESKEEIDMRVGRTRQIDLPDSSHPQVRPTSRLYIPSIGRRGGIDGGQDRRSWRQSVNFENIQSKLKFLKPVGTFWSGREERKVPRAQRVDRRDLPNRLPTIADAEERYVRDPNDQTTRHFQDRLDLCSETDVINECQALNEKISNTALTLVDDWANSSSNSRTRRSKNASVPSDSADAEYLRKMIGVALFDRIKPSKSSLLSQELQNWVADALQASAVSITSRIISGTLSPGYSSTANAELLQTFEGMLSQEEPQATALRWRALTYIHSTRQQRTAVEKFIVARQARLTRCFETVFSLAGEKSTSRFISDLQQAVKESEIIESAIALSEILKTRVLSEYLDVCTAAPKSSFQEDSMDEDSGGPHDVYNGIPVLCTLELGIREVPNRERAGRILLKPRVALGA